MADPAHVPDMDGFDRLTVSLYRAGLVLAAAGLLTLAGAHLAEAHALLTRVGWLLVSSGVALSLANMHLYDRRIRWLIGVLGWTGLVLQLVAAMTGAGTVLLHAGLGFVFAALSALALKEQFCFRIPGLRLVPLILAISLIPMLAGTPLVAGLLLATAGGLLLILAVAKLGQPLHYDIGDKSRYQV